MADKEKLRQMVDDLLAGNDEQAQVNFHVFSTKKMAEIINPQVEPQEQEKLDTPEKQE